MQDLKVEDIAERIVDAILELPTFSRKSLIDTIKPLINIWIKKQNIKKTNNPNIDNLYITIEKTKLESLHWKTLCRSLVSEDEMQKQFKLLQDKNKLLES